MSSHLLLANIDVSFPCFREERRPGGEELLELRVRVLLAAVAAAGRAPPRHFERRGLTGLLLHHRYGSNLNYNPTTVNLNYNPGSWNFELGASFLCGGVNENTASETKLVLYFSLTDGPTATFLE